MTRFFVAIFLITSTISQAQRLYPAVPNMATLLYYNRVKMEQLGLKYKEPIDHYMEMERPTEYVADTIKGLVSFWLGDGSDPYRPDLKLNYDGKRITSAMWGSNPITIVYNPDEFKVEWKSDKMAGMSILDFDGRVTQVKLPYKFADRYDSPTLYDYFYDNKGKIKSYAYKMSTLTVKYAVEYNSRNQISRVFVDDLYKKYFWEYSYNDQGLISSIYYSENFTKPLKVKLVYVKK